MQMGLGETLNKVVCMFIILQILNQWTIDIEFRAIFVFEN